MDLEGLEPSPETLTGSYAAITPQAQGNKGKAKPLRNMDSSVEINEVQFRFGKLAMLAARDKIEADMPPFPIKTCVACGEEFELKPGKPGFANRCPSCSDEDADAGPKSTDVLKTDKGGNAARREAMRNLLYRKDS
jgi:hypothetical protein